MRAHARGACGSKRLEMRGRKRSLPSVSNRRKNAAGADRFPVLCGDTLPVIAVVMEISSPNASEIETHSPARAVNAVRFFPEICQLSQPPLQALSTINRATRFGFWKLTV